jgi:ubiquinone/menaquinone biosynthesis C-methylase UbiE
MNVGEEEYAMPIDFHDEKNRESYALREADRSWREAIQQLVNISGRNVLDIGSGGGIYSRALLEMGAAHVTGVDFSEEMLDAAAENSRDYQEIHYVVGNALDTGLPSEEYDLILERALIHHLAHADLERAFREAFRLLRSGGVLLVQDRTPEDTLLPGSKTNIRGYFFSRYPKLLRKEVERRPEMDTVLRALQRAGFLRVDSQKLWETRARYPNIDALAEDLLNRAGRSILHDLSVPELQDLVDHIREQLQSQGQGNQQGEIVEEDRWTVWSARR